APQDEHPFARPRHYAEELRVDAYELGVVLRAQHVLGGEVRRQGLARGAVHAKHRRPQNRLARRDGGKAGHVDEVARPDVGCLLGFDPGAAGLILYVQYVADVLKDRLGREVAYFDGPAGHTRRHHGADADAPVDFPGRRVVIDVADGAERQHERIGRRIENLHVAGAAGQERDAAQLFGRGEDRADVAQHADARVDQTFEVARAVAPELRPQDPVLERHVG